MAAAFCVDQVALLASTREPKCGAVELYADSEKLHRLRREACVEMKPRRRFDPGDFGLGGTQPPGKVPLSPTCFGARLPDRLSELASDVEVGAPLDHQQGIPPGAYVSIYVACHGGMETPSGSLGRAALTTRSRTLIRISMP